VLMRRVLRHVDVGNRSANLRVICTVCCSVSTMIPPLWFCANVYNEPHPLPVPFPVPTMRQANSPSVRRTLLLDCAETIYAGHFLVAAALFDFADVKHVLDQGASDRSPSGVRSCLPCECCCRGPGKSSRTRINIGCLHRCQLHVYNMIAWTELTGHVVAAPVVLSARP